MTCDLNGRTHQNVERLMGPELRHELTADGSLVREVLPRDPASQSEHDVVKY